jgi:proline iminopeptidase
VRRIYPECWEQLLSCLPETERDDPLAAMYRQLTGENELARRRTAREWALWSGQVVLGDEFDAEELGEHVSVSMVNQARIELHYAVNRHFLDENAVLSGCAKLVHVPVIIVHGRHDLVCPVEASYSLHRCLPNSELRILPRAGHIAGGDEMIHALITAADDMAERFKG